MHPSRYVSCLMGGREGETSPDVSVGFVPHFIFNSPLGLGCEGIAMTRPLGQLRRLLRIISLAERGMIGRVTTSLVSLLSSAGHRWWKATQQCIAFLLSIPKGALSIDRCWAIDNVCHRREGDKTNFFLMYACLFTDSHVRIPFDEFTMGILRTPNVAPTQLHPNSWASLRVFHILAEMFRLKPSPYVFLHFYNSRLAWSVR